MNKKNDLMVQTDSMIQKSKDALNGARKVLVCATLFIKLLENIRDILDEDFTEDEGDE